MAQCGIAGTVHARGRWPDGQAPQSRSSRWRSVASERTAVCRRPGTRASS